MLSEVRRRAGEGDTTGLNDCGAKVWSLSETSRKFLGVSWKFLGSFLGICLEVACFYVPSNRVLRGICNEFLFEILENIYDHIMSRTP